MAKRGFIGRRPGTRGGTDLRNDCAVLGRWRRCRRFGLCVSHATTASRTRSSEHSVQRYLEWRLLNDSHWRPRWPLVSHNLRFTRDDTLVPRFRNTKRYRRHSAKNAHITAFVGSSSGFNMSSGVYVEVGPTGDSVRSITALGSPYTDPHELLESFDGQGNRRADYLVWLRFPGVRQDGGRWWPLGYGSGAPGTQDKRTRTSRHVDLRRRAVERGR